MLTYDGEMIFSATDGDNVIEVYPQVQDNEERLVVKISTKGNSMDISLKKSEIAELRGLLELFFGGTIRE